MQGGVHFTDGFRKRVFVTLPKMVFDTLPKKVFDTLPKKVFDALPKMLNFQETEGLLAKPTRARRLRS